MAQEHFFTGFHRVGAYVEMVSQKGRVDLEIDEKGILGIPEGMEPTGFRLALSVPDDLPLIFAQKNVGRERGEYHQKFASQSNLLGVKIFSMTSPIQVLRVGDNVWTSWHQQNPNRIDCWLLEPDGRLDLFQIGVITHDNGQTFRLLGEYRWRGKLFWNEAQRKIVGKPAYMRWGGFDLRRHILDFPEFKDLLNATVTLQGWNGRAETELNPPLDPIPAPMLARIDWYVVFAGQTGQGIAILHNGESAWVHGTDILKPPDFDGIKRLVRNDLIRYGSILSNWGSKKDGSPKLLKVKRA